MGKYLNSALDDTVIFMKEPTGQEYHDPDHAEYVCLLDHALYGLRQAGHLWHEVFTNDLKDIGLHPLDLECCVYTNSDYTIFFMIDVDHVL